MDAEKRVFTASLNMFQRPIQPAIFGFQNCCVMADSKAGFIVNECHRSQRVAGRHICRLRPVLAVVIGINNMAIFTYRHQTRANFGHVKQQSPIGQRTGMSRFIRLGSRSRLTDHSQAKCQYQKCFNCRHLRKRLMFFLLHFMPPITVSRDFMRFFLAQKRSILAAH